MLTFLDQITMSSYRAVTQITDKKVECEFKSASNIPSYTR